jgi:hypothetical protein
MGCTGYAGGEDGGDRDGGSCDGQGQAAPFPNRRRRPGTAARVLEAAGVETGGHPVQHFWGGRCYRPEPFKELEVPALGQSGNGAPSVQPVVNRVPKVGPAGVGSPRILVRIECRERK